MGRSSHSLLRNPGSNPVLQCEILGKFVFPLHYSILLSCMNEYLAIDSGECVHEQPPCINCSVAV